MDLFNGLADDAADAHGEIFGHGDILDPSLAK